MLKTTLIVMAAGLGNRYGGLKQIDPFGPNGECILEYSIYDAVKAGFDEVVFIIKEEIENAFKDKIGKKIEKVISTKYVFQDINDIPSGYEVPENRVKPWGTGHAVLSARDVVNNPFAVINADDFYGRKSFKLIHDYLCTTENKGFKFCMVGYVLKKTLTDNGHVARGICTIDSSGNLAQIVERTKIKNFYDGPKYMDDESNWVELDPNSIVSLNMWGFTSNFFDKLKEKFTIFLSDNAGEAEFCEFYLPSAVDELLSSGTATVKVLKTHDRWYGVTYANDKDMVKEAIKNLIDKGVYPDKLWE